MFPEFKLWWMEAGYKIMQTSEIKKIIKFNKINNCWHLSGLVLSMTFWRDFILFKFKSKKEPNNVIGDSSQSV